MKRKINVHSPRAEAVLGKLMRQIIRVELKKRDGLTWIYWYWKPINTGLRKECDYSGIREDEEHFETMKTRFKAWLPK